MSIFDYQIDKVTPIPLYFQLKNIILKEIGNGHYREGDLIPTEKEIGDTFNLSRTTVRQAITELVTEGKLYRVKSKGTFIAKPKLKQDFIKRLETFDETIRRLGMEPSTKLLELKVLPAPQDVAEILRLAEGESCIFLFRVRFADQEPNVHVRTWLPFDRCQFITQHDLEKNSLYRILSTHDDTRIYHINRVMEAMPATTEDAKILGIEAGEPVHFFKSIGYNKQEEPIEYSHARYRGDRNRFEVDLYYSEADHS